jgi:hypothetical protein
MPGPARKKKAPLLGRAIIKQNAKDRAVKRSAGCVEAWIFAFFCGVPRRGRAFFCARFPWRSAPDDDVNEPRAAA